MRELLFLAFDHRGSFRSLLNIPGQPDAAELERLQEAKSMVYDGFRAAVEDTVGTDRGAILVDEDYGRHVLERARRDGVPVATCVEKSGQDEFEFDRGDPGFREQLARLQPDFCKVLVRYNPCGDAASNQRQLERLRQLDSHLKATGGKLLFEILVPPTAAQKSDATYDQTVRPGLTQQAIREIYAAGIQPDLWKVEGMDSRSDLEALAETVQAGNPQAGIILLGRGENMAKVSQWVGLAAGVAGITGFAVGRTIFAEPIKQWASGAATRDEAVEQIAANYKQLVEVWDAGR